MTKPIAEHYLKMKEKYADLFKAVEELGKVSKKAGPLDHGCVELIQLGAALANKSEGAVHSHTKRALDAGRSPDEIRHAVLCLINTLGFSTVMAGMSWVEDVL